MHAPQEKEIDFLPCLCTVTVHSYSSLLEFLLLNILEVSVLTKCNNCITVRC